MSASLAGRHCKIWSAVGTCSRCSNHPAQAASTKRHTWQTAAACPLVAWQPKSDAPVSPALQKQYYFHKLPRLPSSQYTYAPCRTRRMGTQAHPTYQDHTCFQTVSQLYSASGTFMQDIPVSHR
jgi:hypothetical protein